jgi:hypothetical protein
MAMVRLVFIYGLRQGMLKLAALGQPEKELNFKEPECNQKGRWRVMKAEHKKTVNSRYGTMRKNTGPWFGALLMMAACQLTSADMDKANKDANASLIREITIGATARKSAGEQFWIKFEKASPCHTFNRVKLTSTGLTTTFDVLLTTDTYPCPTIYTRQDSVQVIFTPVEAGEHTLNFLLNSRLHRVKKVTVYP